MKTYQWGIVAMVDALGFKGIHLRHDPEDVLSAMKVSKAHIEREFSNYLNSNRILIRADMSLRYMSDSVIICLQFDKVTFDEIGETNARFACFTMCEMVLVLTNYWASSSIPLTLRGAVSCGYFCSEDEFLVGKAVDSCAELYEQAQGSFVCLCPETSQSLFTDSEIVRSANVLLVNYPVPLKNQVTRNLHVLHTGVMRGQATDSISNFALQQSMLATFNNGSRDVVIKFENTKRFFDLGNEYLTEQR